MIVWNERTQQDATIRCLLLTSISTYFGASLCPSSCWFFSLHTLLTMHGHRNLKLSSYLRGILFKFVVKSLVIKRSAKPYPSTACISDSVHKFGQSWWWSWHAPIVPIGACVGIVQHYCQAAICHALPVATYQSPLLSWLGRRKAGPAAFDIGG